MQIFFELDRRCDMICSHCLRGKARKDQISDQVMRMTFSKLGNLINCIGIGGGEFTLAIEKLNTLRHELIWSEKVIQKYLEPAWLVTNGKALVKEINKYGEVDDFDENIRIIQTSLYNLSEVMPVILAVSVDTFHDEKSESRFRTIEDAFSMFERIEVCKHGAHPNYLIDMGKSAGSGHSIKLYPDDLDYQIYIAVNGDIWPSCDLSYTFMDKFKDTPLRIGNVLTDTTEQIEYNLEELKKYITLPEDEPYKINEKCWRNCV